MSDEAFVFSTTPEVLMGFPVGEALKESTKPECQAYADVFHERALTAEADGSDEIAKPEFDSTQIRDADSRRHISALGAPAQMPM